MTNGTRRIGLGFLWLSCVLSLAPVARADAQEEARRHFDRALELIDQSQFEAAIVEFNACYALKPHFAVLYNLGQAYISSGDPVRAIDALERYLEQGGRRIDAKRRAAVEAEIQRQQLQTATLELRVAPVGATVRLDGRELGTPLRSPLRLKQGSHVLNVSLNGYQTDERSLSLTAGGSDSVDVSLTPTPAPLPEPATAATSTPSPPTAGGTTGRAAPSVAPTAERPGQGQHPAKTAWSNWRIAGVVSGGLGIAGLAAGTTLWLSARSKHQAALNQWNAGDQTTARQTQNAAVQRVHYADVGLVAGGALLGTGILIYTWDALQAHPHSAVGGTPTFSCALGRDSLHLAIEQKF